MQILLRGRLLRMGDNMMGHKKTAGRPIRGYPRPSANEQPAILSRGPFGRWGRGMMGVRVCVCGGSGCHGNTAHPQA